MLIPSIDLQGGRIVQLVQGDKLAIEATDPERLDQAILAVSARAVDRPRRREGTRRQRGDGRRHLRPASLPRRRRHPSRSSGRRRCSPRGAHAVIASSALFRDGAVDVVFARALAEAIGVERVIAAVDSRGGHVAIHGWKTVLPDHRGRCRPRARAVLRRVPLHARRQGRPDAGDRHRRHPGRPPGHDSPRDRRRRHHDLGRDRPPRRCAASTPSSAWRSTRDSCPWIEMAGHEAAATCLRVGRPSRTRQIHLNPCYVNQRNHYVINVTNGQSLRLRRSRPGEAFVDREVELDRLVSDLGDGQKVFLISPRRYGKSSLIRQALEALAPPRRAHDRGHGQQLQLLPRVPRGLRRGRSPSVETKWDRARTWLTEAIALDAARDSIRAEGDRTRPVRRSPFRS